MPILEASLPSIDSPPRLIRKRNRPRMKLNESKIIELAELGVSNVDIAKQQGVVHKTIWQFLKDRQLKKKQIAVFKEHRADILAALQGDCLDVQSKILRSLDDGVINALKQGEKTGLLMALNATAGTSFDKERLQRGQSTSNQSIISRMLDETVKDLYKKPQPVVVHHVSSDHHDE
jgi:hypothetical protein